MTSKELQKENLRKEIGRLQRELEMLEAEPTVSLDDVLNTIEDFTTIPNAAFREAFGTMTVRELLSLHPENILKTRDVGRSTMRSLFFWMKKHKLKFISITEEEFEIWFKNHYHQLWWRRLCEEG